MKTFIKGLSILATCACAGMTITSCTADKDYFDPNAIAQQAKDDYVATFKTMMTNYNTVPSWDLATYSATLPSQNEFNGLWSTELTKVDPALVNSISDVMLEYYLNYDGYNNEDKGERVDWLVPDNDFSLQPIFVGFNGCDFKVWMTVEIDENTTQEYLLTTKDDGSVMVKPTANSSLRKPGDNGTTLGAQNTGTKIIDNKKYVVFKPAYEVQSKTITFKKGTFPVGAKITFRSEAKRNGKTYNYSSTSQEHNEFILLNPDYIPESLKDNNKQYTILACEAGADWDLNDVIFMVSGEPYIPQSTVIIDNPTGERDDEITYTKRYMVEDLGAAQASDIDFNDLVFDIEEKTHRYYSSKIVNQEYDLNNEVEDLSKREVLSQTLTIHALGGTKDIELFVGGQSVFKKSNYEGLDYHTMYNTGRGPKIDPIVINLTDFPWKPSENNIKVIVGGPSEPVQTPDDVKWEIRFPMMGDVPSVIAVNYDTPWNAERESVFDESSNLKLKRITE